jgi:hypothetical protein
MLPSVLIQLTLQLSALPAPAEQMASMAYF